MNSTNYQKILPRAGYQSQSREFVELQSIAYNQQASGFDYLHGNFNVTRGLKVHLLSVTGTNYKGYLSAGQVYYQGYFLDVPEINFECDGSTTLSLEIKFTETKGPSDPTIYPIDGPSGASRLVASYTLRLNDQGLPLVRITAEAPDQIPKIEYACSGSANQETAQKLKQELYRFFYEAAGDFIAYGLQVNIKDRQIIINPGRAYIRGKLVEKNYTSYLSLEPQEVHSLVLEDGDIFTLDSSEELILEALDCLSYYIVLNDKHEVACQTTSAVDNQINLARIIDYSKLNSQETGYRSVPISTLIELESTNDRIQQDILEISKTRRQDLSEFGVVSEASLPGDINHPEYSATFLKDTGAIRSGVRSTPIGVDNLQVIKAENLNSQLQPLLVNQVQISQPRSNDWLSLTPQTQIYLEVTPSRGLSTQAYEVEIPDNLTSLDKVNIKLGSTLSVRKVQLRATGMAPNTNGLRLTFGSIPITNYTVTKGLTDLQGLKANADGILELEFNIPSQLPPQDYIITLSSPTASGQVVYQTTTQVPRIQASGRLAQTFKVQEAMMITGVRVKLRSIPDNSEVLRCQVVPVYSSCIDTTVLTKGRLLATNSTTSPDGSRWSEITLEQTYLAPGTYALIFETSLNGVELFIEKEGPAATSEGEPVCSDLHLWSGQWCKKNWDLSYEILKGIPQAAYGEIIYRVNNPLDTINSLVSYLPAYIPLGTSVNYYYLSNGKWLPLRCPYQNNLLANQVDLKVVFHNTLTLSPSLDLDSSFIVAQHNLGQSSWIRKTQRFNPYTQVDVTLEYYQPLNTELKVKLSSNLSQTWEELTPGAPELVDGNVPLYRNTWSVTLPASVDMLINGSMNKILRENLTLRVDFEAGSNVPYFRSVNFIVN